MAKKGKVPNPDLLTQMTETVAAAKEAVLKPETLEKLRNIKPEELIVPDSHPEVIKGTAKRSGGWMHSPALLELFAVADRRLTRVARQMGMEVVRVERVLARLVPTADLLILKPAPAEDKTAIPVNRYGSRVTVNLINLLGEHGKTVESGYKQRYEVDLIPQESPLWPALLIDLSDVKERRQTRSRTESTSPATPE